MLLEGRAVKSCSVLAAQAQHLKVETVEGLAQGDELNRLQASFSAHHAGEVRILNFVSVDDTGVVINPKIVAGQIRGRIAQGIGQALYEALVYDDSGQPMSTTFASYFPPSAAEIPLIHCEDFNTPSNTPLGVRGVGESGTPASTPAVVNAVADALAPFGVYLEQTPLHPDVIWEQLNLED